MFRGTTELNLDEKGRLAMPSRYRDKIREECEGQLIVTRSLEGCLQIVPLPLWEQLEAQLTKLSGLDPAAADLRRFLVAPAEEIQLDKAGRFVIPPHLRQFAGLDKQVVMIGLINRFELWDKSTWEDGDEARRANALEAIRQGASPALQALSL